MKITRERRKHSARHGEPVILFSVGEYTFAAPATDVDEIRDLQGIDSIAPATQRTSVSKVKATLERSNKLCYVVDASQHFRLGPATASRLMVLRSQPVAVLVDSIDRMAEIEQTVPIPKAFSGDERRWYRELTILNDIVIPIVNTSAFLTPAEQVIAKSVVSRLAKGVTA